MDPKSTFLAIVPRSDELAESSFEHENAPLRHFNHPSFLMYMVREIVILDVIPSIPLVYLSILS